jgi:hypothetical protein
LRAWFGNHNLAEIGGVGPFGHASDFVRLLV